MTHADRTEAPLAVAGTAAPEDILLLTTEAVAGRAIRAGGLVTASAVGAANILRDIREHITNTFGGRMRRYEELVEQTLERALASLRQKAANEGYDGVVALRISHPVVTQGGVEIIVYGTGFVFSAGE